MLDFDLDKHCYGCGSCAYSCPTKAIELVTNEEGFVLPHTHRDLCVDCNKCQRSCPYYRVSMKGTTPTKAKVLAVYRKEKTDYQSYTSSGVFRALAQKTLEEGGGVCGCVWNEVMEAIHVITQDLETVKRMSGSKYVQSDLSNCYQQMERVMKQGDRVLFSGTPCQVAGVISNLGNLDHLVTCSIVCHGTPSPLVWKKYVEFINNKHGAKLVDANFRHKGRFGWITPYSKYRFHTGKELVKLSFTDDPYVVAFGQDVFHRNSCYHCQYKYENNVADIIIGDYWGCSQRLLEASENKGISVVILASAKGKDAFAGVVDQYETEAIDIELAIRENKPLQRPVAYTPKRELFFKALNTGRPIQEALKISKDKKILLKKVLYQAGAFEKFKRWKYKRTH